jgi:hypothetical protein
MHFRIRDDMGDSLRTILIAAACLAVCGPGHAQALKVTETDSLRLLYFDPSETYLVPRMIQTYHDSLDRQKSILGFDPDEKTTVLLTDFTDIGNARAGAVPSNSLMFDIAPIPFTFETFAPAERMYTLMNHELIHIVTTDKSADVDSSYRKFFGGKVMATAEHPETILYQYLTAPRDTSPRWFLEGIAVFQETWMAGGLGRSQGGYTEMVFRSKVRDGSHIYDPLGLVSEGVQVDFQVGANAYLYGERFMSYIAYTYTPEKLVEWVARANESRRNYENEFARVFGITLNDAWQSWIEFEHEFQERNLAEIRRFPITPYEDLAESALGSVSRTFYDVERDSLIAGVRAPGVVSHIGEYPLSTRKLEHIEDVKVPMLYRVTSLAYDESSKTVFYTADNYAYRDIMAIDLVTGKKQMLLEDQRIGDLAFNRADRSLWGIRHLNGYASLVRMPYPYDEWKLIKSLPYGEVVYDLDISPDGTLLSASFGDIQGKQTLKIFPTAELMDDKFEPEHSVEFGQAVPESFVFSPDGRFLFGSAYYTGVSNIFRYELASNDLEAVTNAETGFFRPVPLDNENLIVFRYTGDGFMPARIKAEPLEDLTAITFLGTEVIRKHPQLETWRAGSPDSPAPESRIVSEGDYVAIENMRLESIYPTVLGYKDSVSLGLKAIISDHIRLDSLSIGAAYSLDSELPSEERPNLSVEYRHTVVSASPLSGTWRMGAQLNNADFYDLFGPTKQSRKGQRYFVGYEKTLLFDEPRVLSFATQLNYHRDMEALPRYQNIPVTFDELTTFGAELNYAHMKKSLGAVDYEKGFRWHLGAGLSHVDGDTIPKIQGDFDFGFALPWKHSSIWFRSAMGAAFGEPDDEFANFFFGGFGNNYVDRGEIKRYREYYAFPGFELNAIPGRNFYRGMLEWNFPPIRFERAGTSRFYLAWARPAVFVSSLTSNIDDDAIRLNAQNIGIQIDFHISFMSRYAMTLSTGYAKGYGEGDFTDDEFMISLKIM